MRRKRKMVNEGKWEGLPVSRNLGPISDALWPTNVDTCQLTCIWSGTFFCGLCLAVSCFKMTVPPCNKASSINTCFSFSLVSKNLIEPWPQTPSNTFERNWDSNYDPGLIIQHQRLTSCVLCGWIKANHCSKLQWINEGSSNGRINAHSFGTRCSTILFWYKVEWTSYYWQWRKKFSDSIP